MDKIRVLLVDDSAVIRRILREAFSSDSAFDVVGTAVNGRAALTMVGQSRPDIVILDIEMPEMDGLQTLSEIRASHPKLPIIMFSTLTNHGTVATIEALTRGATDYVTKSSDLGKYSDAVDQIKQQLLPRAKVICTSALLSCNSTAGPYRHASSGKAFPYPKRIDVVAIGTSTGGPNALACVLPVIPRDFPVPILIVQHMPPLFTKFLAERLAACSQIPVTEARRGEEVLSGGAWIAPGDCHMTVIRNGLSVRVEIDRNPAENSCRPSVDVLFRSVAKAYGGNVLALVMTGMGQDGLVGCEHIKQAGGRVMVQDEYSSVVWGMPGFVAKAGLADQVLPLEQIGPEIVRKIRLCNGLYGKHSQAGVEHGHRRAGV